MHQFPKFTPSWNSTCFGKIWEIGASGWFNYKEICEDARSHEHKICVLYSSQEDSVWTGTYTDSTNIMTVSDS
jgi:hypothetical protein